MSLIPEAPSFWWLVVPLLVAAGCSHDTSRDNPLDPQLTPAVEDVTVEVDETTGTATVAWAPYSGQQPFAAYWVLRREAELVKVDTVRILDVQQTTFRDTTLKPEAEYLYWVAVVNQAGFVQEYEPSVRVPSFSVRWDAQLGVSANNLAGTVSLRWEQYRGARFERYEVWRRGLGGEGKDTLTTVAEPAATVWTDTTAVPDTDYLYRVTAFAAGKERPSEEAHGRFELPAVELARADFDYRTATAQLEWSQYRGPKFVAYEVRRHVGGNAEETVREITDLGSTTYTDSLLHGDTEYVYRVGVRTTWEGKWAFSNTRRGSFYTLEEVIQVDPGIANYNPHAVSLSLDEEDRLYVAMTMLRIHGGITSDSLQVAVQQGQEPCRQYRCGIEATPHAESPVRTTVGQGVLYVSVASDQDSILVAALDENAE